MKIFEEDILYYDLPDRDDYIAEYKMLTGEGKTGKMKTPIFSGVIHFGEDVRINLPTGTKKRGLFII